MVELLAPCGEYNSFLGAINAGADAVYLAGNMYGARASAVNFSCEEIIKAIRYAHLFNRKVFLTVNTLTKDEELDKLYDFLKPLYESGLDAVIVQDIGVFHYIKENFKDLDIHVSTQAVVTSEYGTLFYKNLGASRVVLARELTLNEIKNITKTGIETECFIHGAMCYSYSGMCLFSSFLGGNSGNRGRCKGPCRQPYKINGKEAYYLSLSDMNTIDIIDKLIDAGIYSFKIEGRLKSPSYAAGVTSVYRKYIDFCLENPGKELVISKDNMNLLKTLYSRKSSGRGYYERVSSKNMITFERGAYEKVDDSLEKSIVSEYIEKPVKKDIDFSFEGFVGNKARLSYKLVFNGNAYEGSCLSENVLEEAKNAPTSEADVLKQLSKLGNTSFKLNDFKINIDNAFIPSSVLNNLRRDAVEKIENDIYETDRIATEKINTKDISYNIRNNDLNFGNDNIDLNFNNENNDLLVGNDINKNDKNFKSFCSECNDDTVKNVTKLEKIAFVDSFEQFNTVKEHPFIDTIVIKQALLKKLNKDDLKSITKNLYLELPPVLRSLNVEEFNDLLKQSLEIDAINGIYVNQYDAYYLAKSTGYSKDIRSNTNIYSYNSVSSAFNAKLFSNILCPSELAFYDIKSLKSERESVSVIMYGRAPLMHTANCIMKTNDSCFKQKGIVNDEYITLKDRLGVDFKVKTLCDDNLCFNTIYNSKPTSLHKYYDKFNNFGFGSYSFVFTDEKAPKTKGILDFYKSIFEGWSANADFDYTAFHMKNGIL